jgi:hypothetical protein
MRKVPPPPANKPVRFIACSERTQTFNWQKTSGIASDIDYSAKNKRKVTRSS